MGCAARTMNGQVVAEIVGYVGSSQAPEEDVIRAIATWEEVEARGDIPVPSLTPGELEQQVSQGNEPVLVYFGEPWMGSSQTSHRVKVSGPGRYASTHTRGTYRRCQTLVAVIYR